MRDCWRYPMREKDVLSPTAFWDEIAPYYDEYIASTRYKFFKPEAKRTEGVSLPLSLQS